MFADKEYIQKRAEMMKSGVSWSELSKLQIEYDKREREKEKLCILRKSQDRKKEMDHYYQLKMKRVQEEKEENEQVLKTKQQERDELENTNRSQWMDIKNKIDYRQDLAERLGSKIGDYRNRSKEMPPAPENMTIIYETNEYKMRRAKEAREHHERLKIQRQEKEDSNERMRIEKLEEETAYLSALEKQKIFEEEEMTRRRKDLSENQTFLKRQMSDRKEREDGEDRLTKREIAYNRYMFVPSRPPYL